MEGAVFEIISRRASDVSQKGRAPQTLSLPPSVQGLMSPTMCFPARDLSGSPLRSVYLLLGSVISPVSKAHAEKPIALVKDSRAAVWGARPVCRAFKVWGAGG